MKKTKKILDYIEQVNEPDLRDFKSEMSKSTIQKKKKISLWVWVFVGLLMGAVIAAKPWTAPIFFLSFILLCLFIIIKFWYNVGKKIKRWSEE